MAKRNVEYRIGKQKVPSVTTVLDIIHKPELYAWIKWKGWEASEKIRDAAGEFGSTVHGAIEALISDGQTPYFTDQRMATTVSNFKAWADSNVKEWICFEKAVFHDELGYAGTTDAFAVLNSGKLVYIDFKTSKSVKWEYYLQCAAYCNATRVEDDAVDLSKVQGAIILHLDHDSLTWEALNCPMSEEYFEYFKAALLLYKARPKGG